MCIVRAAAMTSAIHQNNAVAAVNRGWNVALIIRVWWQGCVLVLKPLEVVVMNPPISSLNSIHRKGLPKGFISSNESHGKRSHGAVRSLGMLSAQRQRSHVSLDELSIRDASGVQRPAR